MHLVDNKHLMSKRRGERLDVLFEVADLVNAAIGCGVYFDDIQCLSGIDRCAGLTFVAGFSFFGKRRIGGSFLAVDDFSQNAGGGCFARTARPIEKIRVRDAVGRRFVAQNCDDVFLSHQFSKILGAIGPIG